MNAINEETSIIDFLLSHKKSNPVSFHMPGHKGSKFYKKLGYHEFLDNITDCDITEIHGADNLFQAETIIKYTEERYKRLYDVKKSYLLINGTSCGLISAILSSVKPGEKLIMARNSHKSIFNAVELGNISPVYVHPKLVESYGIGGEIEADEIKKIVSENKDAKAVVLPSPNYYGICSDIEKIADIVHSAGMILIVDQAHGAHLKFFEGYNLYPKAAESCGADIVVNSIHKTLGSFTQSAVMNVVTDSINLELLEDKLQSIESTSPSYLLMASLDINAKILEDKGCDVIGEWHEELNGFYYKAKLIQGLKIINTGENMDSTKINLDMSAIGISGPELENLLMKENIYVELVTGNIVMCMTGVGNEKEDYERLLSALKKISEDRIKTYKGEEQTDLYDYVGLIKSISAQESAISMPKEKVKLNIDLSEDCICAVSIIPYPPGIPLICPGEPITKEAIRYVKYLRESGQKVMGIDENNCIVVGK
ncbi:MAG: aminotransferase class I/II-fold pyridoxal phosphate-dependent enzyme [Aminipila sp.]